MPRSIILPRRSAAYPVKESRHFRSPYREVFGCQAWITVNYVTAGRGHLKSGTGSSERDGMRYIAGLLKDAVPVLDVRYFESGEVYTYCEK